MLFMINNMYLIMVYISPGWSSMSTMNTFQPVVMSGPSGSGKSTMVKKLMAEYKDCFAFSVSRKSIIYLFGRGVLKWWGPSRGFTCT